VSAPPPAGPESPEDLVRALLAEGIRDRRVLAGFRDVPRARFVPRFADLAAQARANLAAAGVAGVTVVVGDGTLGVPEHAPYQAIVVAAAAPRVPGPLVEQLADGGRLVHPVGPGGREEVTVFAKQAGRLVAGIRLVPARFVPLVGTHGTRAGEDRGGP
jgi:protein-L-isoaspartate O-methyltransferase